MSLTSKQVAIRLKKLLCSMWPFLPVGFLISAGTCCCMKNSLSLYMDLFLIAGRTLCSKKLSVSVANVGVSSDGFCSDGGVVSAAVSAGMTFPLFDCYGDCYIYLILLWQCFLWV